MTIDELDNLYPLVVPVILPRKLNQDYLDIVANTNNWFNKNPSRENVIVEIEMNDELVSFRRQNNMSLNRWCRLFGSQSNRAVTEAKLRLLFPGITDEELRILESTNLSSYEILWT